MDVQQTRQTTAQSAQYQGTQSWLVEYSVLPWYSAVCFIWHILPWYQYHTMMHSTTLENFAKWECFDGNATQETRPAFQDYILPVMLPLSVNVQIKEYYCQTITHLTGGRYIHYQWYFATHFIAKLSPDLIFSLATRPSILVLTLARML